ncbi:hypothetical protein [Streptomyces sp. NPDC007905]
MRKGSAEYEQALDAMVGILRARAGFFRPARCAPYHRPGVDAELGQ